MRVQNRHRAAVWVAAISVPAIVAGTLIAASLASSSQAAAQAATRIAMSSNTTSVASPTTPIWSTQLDFDNNGTAW